jgi:hypothetical protein
LFDQGYLLCPVPVFQFFFAVDGIQDVGEVLVVDEASYVVFGGVGSGSLFSVLLYAEADVVGETYVEAAGATGEDVDVEVIFALRHLGRIAEVVAGEKRIPPLRYGMTNKRGFEMVDEVVVGQKQIPPLRYGMTNKQILSNCGGYGFAGGGGGGGAA